MTLLREQSLFFCCCKNVGLVVSFNLLFERRDEFVDQNFRFFTINCLICVSRSRRLHQDPVGMFGKN
jgi:hypothetical protein